MTEEQFKNKIIRQNVEGKDCLTFRDDLPDGREATVCEVIHDEAMIETYKTEMYYAYKNKLNNLNK